MASRKKRARTRARVNTNHGPGRPGVKRAMELDSRQIEKTIINAKKAADRGKHQEAIAILNQGILKKKHQMYFFALGSVYKSIGEARLCEESLVKALRCKQKLGSEQVLIEILKNLFELGCERELLEDIEACLREYPECSELQSYYGLALCKNGNYEASCQVACRIARNYPDGAVNIAGQLLFNACYDEVKQICEAVLEHKDSAIAYNIMALMYQKTLRLNMAEHWFRKGLEKYPEQKALMGNLANCLGEKGDGGSAVAIFEDILKTDLTNEQNLRVRHELCFNRHYSQSLDWQVISDESKAMGELMGPAGKMQISWSNDPKPDKILKIGYISGDFRLHSVTYFFLSFFMNHNPGNVEAYVYCNTSKPDDITEIIREKAAKYVSVLGWPDDKVAEQIQADGIDIMVDLGGLTSDTKISALKTKPAPIQIEYLGYPDTVGLPAIDYRISDTWADPDENQEFHSEELAWLPDCFLCYRPPEWASPISPIPSKDNGYVTFGSFNSQKKMNPLVIGLWSTVLHSVENSRIVIKIRQTQEDPIEEMFLKEFENCGITRDRIEILNYQPGINHLDNYSKIDIALDTYPYHGTTTTCEAFWMGVPVISLIGQHHESRVGLTLLKALDMEVFAAFTPDEFVQRAVALASDEKARESLRMNMRNRMMSSVLCDAQNFTNNLETMYRQMWYRWCERRGTGPLAEQKIEVLANSQQAELSPNSSNADSGKISLGIIHGLSGSGTTHIAQSMGSMDKTNVMTVHPRHIEEPFNPWYQAINRLEIFGPDELASMGEWSWTDCIEMSAKACQARGERLTLHANSHLDFLGYPLIRDPFFLSTTVDALGGICTFNRISIVRNPLSQWLWIQTNEALRGWIDFDTFMHGYRMFAEMAARTGFMRIEDFYESPEVSAEKVSSTLGNTYDAKFLEVWRTGETGKYSLFGDVGPDDIVRSPNLDAEFKASLES